MTGTTRDPIDMAVLRRELEALGVAAGGVVMVHSSLSAFGAIAGGAPAVIEALLRCLGEAGTLVMPAFTPQIADPHPGAGLHADAAIMGARDGVPLFGNATPTPMGAIPNALLAHPQHRRSPHPQASVAAIGPHARTITRPHPLPYALGKHSPFERMHALRAQILLLGVGHNRNSFLHYAEAQTARHRTKLRRFPWLARGARVWVEAPDVGDDNGVHFPRIGAEADRAGLIRHRVIGQAACQLMDSTALVEFARQRLDAWLSPAS
ncbi:aminoglycoside N(3)-acetyltransferase [Dyella sp. C9]|uniref:aminoglycoside N(3)-acetyltransferase n=1 Tax=Dyella sp. C9 TaxID=2202154 RepID=UPI000DEFA206|nr:AAC(3) family N-acetyltransferase [Dyella sp. C9]